MSVETLHKDYSKFSNQWNKTRALLEGDSAIKALGTEIVPAFASMFDGTVLNQTAYKAFLAQATLSEHALKISTNANGLLYAKDPVIEVPKYMEEMLEDITLTGQSLIDLSKEGTSEVFNVSRVCYLIDVAKDERAENKKTEPFTARPFIQLYKTESVINWKYERVGGVQKLTQVVLQESENNWIDEFTNEPETIYRVLRLTKGVYTQQVYKKGKEKEDEFEGGEILIPLNASKSLNKIPFYGINQLVSSLDIIKAPLVPIVNLNLLHFLRSVDKGKQLHEMAAGTIAILGAVDYDAKNFLVGGVNVIPSDMGKTPDVKIVERSGDGMPSQERELELIENTMYKLGAGIIQRDKAGIEAADTQNARTIGERSVVVSVATTFSQSMTNMLKDFGEWSGAKPTEIKNIRFELNTDYIDNILTVEQIVKLGEVNALVPQMTKREMFDYLVRGGAIVDGTDYETHQTLLEEEEPKMSVSPLQPKKDKESDVNLLSNIAGYIGLGNTKEA